jgi:hypothetical protein
VEGIVSGYKWPAKCFCVLLFFFSSPTGPRRAENSSHRSDSDLSCFVLLPTRGCLEASVKRSKREEKGNRAVFFINATVLLPRVTRIFLTSNWIRLDPPLRIFLYIPSDFVYSKSKKIVHSPARICRFRIDSKLDKEDNIRIDILPAIIRRVSIYPSSY